MADISRKEYKQVIEKQKEMKPIFDRMDEDEKIYLLHPYEMYKLPPRGNQKMENVANVTMPDPLLFCTKAIAIICGATMQTIVEGRKLTKKQPALIERFLEDIYYMIDERLPKRRLTSLDAYINEQIMLRGRIGARPCLRVDNKLGLVADVVPFDTRYYVDDVDGDDILWGAPWFMRSREAIERQYNKDGDTKLVLNNKNAVVIDYWDKEKEIVFVDGRIIREQPNPYGYVPIVETICPIGSMFSSEGAFKHQGESILWANRNLWEEKNRTVSILQTVTVNGLFGALQYESEKGEGADRPEKSPWQPETVHPVEKGMGYERMPLEDVKRATSLVYSIIEASLQRGSLSAIDYGTLTFPLSAIAITRLTGSRDDIFLPRVQAKSLFYRALSRMMIDQCIALNETLEIGRAGSTNEYTKADLDGDYSISYRFFTETKEQGIANLAIANAAQDYLSPETIMEKVLQLDDPAGERIKWEAHQAEKLDKLVLLFRRACSLLDKEEPSLQDQLEAWILSETMETVIQQRKQMGKLSPMETGGELGESDQRAKQFLPLLAKETGGGGRAAQAEMSSPQETESRED